MTTIARNERIILGAVLAATIVSATPHIDRTGGAILPFLVSAAA